MAWRVAGASVAPAAVAAVALGSRMAVGSTMWKVWTLGLTSSRGASAMVQGIAHCATLTVVFLGGWWARVSAK